MKEIKIDFKNFNHVNRKLLKNYYKNIDNSLKKAIQKNNFIKAQKLKEFKKLLHEYIVECKIINDNNYLSKITNKLDKLNKEITILNNNENNTTLIDIYIPKHNNEYINLILIFIYKFCKINHKILQILLVDYLKRIFYIIKNNNTDKNYNNISLYDYIILNNNNKIKNFLEYIEINKLEDNLINNINNVLDNILKNKTSINIIDINKLSKNPHKTEFNLDPLGNIFKNNNQYFLACKNILKDFFIKYPTFNNTNYKINLKKYLKKQIIYNKNNLDYILNKCPMKIEYNINTQKIELDIDINYDQKTYVYYNLMKLVTKINKYYLNYELKKYNIKLNQNTIILIKIIFLIFTIDLLKDEYDLKNDIKFLETNHTNNLFSINFTNDQEFVYDIIFNNFFSNYNNINYNLNNKIDNDINIYIYKSKHNFINILFIFIYYIFNVNKKNICTNLKKLLIFFKKEIIKIINLKKYKLGCDNIYDNIKLETFCLNNYNIFNNNFNLKIISNLLLDIINNNKFKIKYTKSTDQFEFIINYANISDKIVDELTNKQFLSSLNNDINSFLKKDINKEIIILLCKFIENITNIFFNIITNNKLFFNILNIPINDSDGKNIYQYLNTNIKKEHLKEFSKLNFQIRKLCIIIFIKLFIKYLISFFSVNNQIDNIFDDIINQINKLICNKLNIEFTYNIKNIFDTFINKNSFIFTN